VALAAIIAILSSIIVFQPNPFTQSMMGGSGMMSGMTGASMNMPFLWPSILTISSVAILLGVAYAIAFPPIKTSEEGAAAPIVSPIMSRDGELRDPLSVLIRASKPEEGSVLQVLHDSRGVCRQKDVVFKTGLSKLKVHRIIARLADRNIIQVKKIGKTNELTLPHWLMQDKPEP
jgi:uncharacterized membrane protein